ncbi:MAG: 16S rRNA (guanine(527)-N(7))-methyltransferase RsmG [Candidatus Acidiferrales bacterium]
MTILTDSVISEELRTYGVSARADICSAIRTFISLLLHWNRTISLTAVTDPLEILRFHFGESMFAASVISNLNGRLADVGSGAGFPGIPLKLAIPALELVLIESNAKKAAFLAEAVRDLGLERTEIYRGRFEGFRAEGPEFDFVAARAIGRHEELINWARGAIKKGGSLALWLGADDAARVSLDRTWQWREPVPIPGSHSRTILVGVAD